MGKTKSLVFNKVVIKDLTAEEASQVVGGSNWCHSGLFFCGETASCGGTCGHTACECNQDDNIIKMPSGHCWWE
jgi:hypothetical protein